jgi:intraflagellar transport protein 43
MLRHYITVIDNIPDIDELHEEEQATQIATPPSAAVLQIATYKQLDADLMKHTQLFTMNGEVNLKLLAKAISPESEVKEEEKAWEWDKLFTELSNDIKEIWRVGKEGVNVSTTSS